LGCGLLKVTVLCNGRVEKRWNGFGLSVFRFPSTVPNFFFFPLPSLCWIVLIKEVGGLRLAGNSHHVFVPNNIKSPEAMN
jgi:hypothetical protein